MKGMWHCILYLLRILKLLMILFFRFFLERSWLEHLVMFSGFTISALLYVVCVFLILEVYSFISNVEF